MSDATTVSAELYADWPEEMLREQLAQPGFGRRYNGKRTPVLLELARRKGLRVWLEPERACPADLRADLEFLGLEWPCRAEDVRRALAETYRRLGGHSKQEYVRMHAAAAAILWAVDPPARRSA
jgi:hypothetical protein